MLSSALPVQRAGAYNELTLPTARVKLADLGRALAYKQLSSPDAQEPLVIFGMPGYRPPEVRGRSGIWRLSLCVPCAIF